MRSDAVLERLKRLHPVVIDLSLGRIARLLASLGHPEDRLPPVVHVAGTNGKGSVIAFLGAMARAAGLRTHAYTSPHLVAFHERIALDGRHIADDALLALLEECEAANGDAPITFFEITTAAAFLAFARAPADLALIEVGLGGRFDATNVIARPRLTAITPIAMDHMHYLGDTLARIAFEKAGILKPGVPAVIGRQAPEALGVIEARAGELAAPLTLAGRDYGPWTGAAPSLAGAHQRDNAAQAAACARLLGIGEAAIAAGVGAAVWPGRMQRLAQGRLADRLARGWELWLDGGHNPGAAEAIAAMLAAWRDRPVRLVYGMLNTRVPADFLAPLAPYVAGIATVTIPGEPNAIPAEVLARGRDRNRPSGRASRLPRRGARRDAARPARPRAGVRLALPRRRRARRERLTARPFRRTKKAGTPRDPGPFPQQHEPLTSCRSTRRQWRRQWRRPWCRPCRRRGPPSAPCTRASASARPSSWRPRASTCRPRPAW